VISLLGIIVIAVIFDWCVWLAAAVGAFVLIWLAGFLCGRQYE
jgi:hypothetical protein